MGIPAFFRWIIERYPKCLKPAVEVDENIFLLNKNGEFDTLYIDANDLLHTAVHPEIAQSPKDLKHMMENFVFLLEQQVKIIRPRSLLYIAFDGVAPRAKMNLQRARRYRVAKENEKRKNYVGKIDEYRESQGLANDETVEAPFDFSCITPGTRFMRDVSKALRDWIRKMQLENSYWSNLYIVVDDSSVPGEGEHKIMQRIRAARLHPSYNPKNSIAISGRDADLIILGLGTHEPNISVLRQVTYFGKMVRCPMCFRAGHARECVYPPRPLPERPEVGYALFSLKTFRSFLWSEFREASQRHDPPIDFELMVNDYMLLTFFVGNDFLPRLAGTCIRNGTLDLLIECYITYVTIHGKTISNAKGEIDPAGLKSLLKLVGIHEKEIVGSLAKLNRNNIYKKKKKKKDDNSSFYKFSSGAFGSETTEQIKQTKENLQELFPLAIFNETSIPWFEGLTKGQQLRYLDVAMFEVPASMRGRNRVFKALGQWKKRYYANCFSLNVPSDLRDHDLFAYPEVSCILREYMRGIQWVFSYYLDKNPNWEWFYPFAYGPCVTDLVNIDFNPDERFQPDEPISPLISLMAVLPPASIHILPEVFHPLITFPESPIADLYPETCHVDYSDAFYWWQGIMHLPYMETERISTALLPLMSKLTEEDLKLNEFGRPVLFCVAPISDIGESLFLEYQSSRAGESIAAQPQLHVKDEFAVYGRAVEPISNFRVLKNEGGKLSSVAAFLIPHEMPPMDFSVKDGLGYDPTMQGYTVARQRFGSLASSRKATILTQRREMVKEMRVMGRDPKQKKRPAREHNPASAGHSGGGSKPNLNIDMMMQAFQMLKMAGANPEQISQLLAARENQAHSGSGAGREESHSNNHPMMSVPNPVAVGHRGSQPYQSVMKPMSKDKDDKLRGGEPDPEMEPKQQSGPWNQNNQGGGFNGGSGGPVNMMQQMNQEMQQSPMSSMLSQMMNSMSPQQMMQLIMSQQSGGMMSPPRSPLGMGGYGHPNQPNMMQAMQQQMMMQNMISQMMHAQQLVHNGSSEYAPSDDGSSMSGYKGMPSQMGGIMQHQDPFMGGMDNMMSSPMGSMASPSPSHRFSRMDSPQMAPTPPPEFQGRHMGTPGMGHMGFWAPSSPSAAGFGMNQMPMSPHGMSPSMSPMNQGMMFNQQMNPQGFMPQNQQNMNNNGHNNNHQTRI